MEQASSAREFIQRFHLPQLVRIAREEQPDNDSADDSFQDTSLNGGRGEPIGPANCRRSLCDTGARRQRQQQQQQQTPGLRRPFGATGHGPGEAPSSIRLAPTSKRPTLSKLQLEQPFLVYKAYKKLELLAYANDSKNELNVRSGDPIYFPHNYRGKSLESIDCRSMTSVHRPFGRPFSRAHRPGESVSAATRSEALARCQLGDTNERLEHCY